jgi:hypothetical protein
MYKKLLTITFMTIALFSCKAQNACEQLRKQKMDFSKIDSESLKKQLLRLSACGFDSVECLRAATLAGVIATYKSDVYFGELINLIRSMPPVTIQRPVVDTNSSKNDYHLCERPLYADIYKAFGNYPAYFDYEQAVRCAKAQKKGIMLYFTGHSCANAIKMKSIVLSDPEIRKAILDNFVVAALYVDGNEENAKQNFAMEKQMGYEFQPLTVFYSVDGKKSNLVAGYEDKETFLRTLRKAIEITR